MKAVLFDLDCTLVDRRRSIGRYAGFFYEHFQSRLAGGKPSAVTEVLIAADGSGYRRAAERAGDIVAGLGWNDAPTPCLRRRWVVSVMILNGKLASRRGFWADVD